MVYKGYTIKPYVVIRNGYKYSITKPDGFTHVCSVKTLKEAKMLVNYDIKNKENEMEKIKALNASEIVIVRHLAKRSKMDCWLCVENDGTIRDLEDNGKKLTIKKAITDMVEGLTPYDVEILTPKEVVTFVSLISKLN